MRHLSLFIVLAIFLLVSGCKKSAELETGYIPFFNGSPVAEASDKNYKFKASFKGVKPANVKTYGFELSEKDATKPVKYVVSTPNSEIVLQIDTSFMESNSYKIRAWVEVGSKIFYSSYTYFTGLGYPVPVITSLSKNYAFRGEAFYIYGKYFSANGLTVKIDNIQCNLLNVAFDFIKVQMPRSNTKGKVKISVNVSGKEAVEAFEIENYWPEIYSVTPQSTTFGGEISIKGKFHSEYADKIFPIQNNNNRYIILKYTEDEIIITSSNDMDCDTVYFIYLSIIDEFNNYEVLNTGYNVQHNGNWHIVQNLPFVVNGYAVNSLSFNGKGYIICPIEFTTDFPFWSYDPQTDKWNRLASFPGVFRNYCVFVESKGLIYCGSGYNSQNEFLSDFWKFDPAVNTWTRCADLKFKSNSSFIFGGNIQDTLYVFSTLNNQKAKYIPASNTWLISECTVPELNDSDKHMFVYNGNYYFQGISSFYQYDLATDSFVLQYYMSDYTLYGAVFKTGDRLFMNSGVTKISELDLINKRAIPHLELSNYLNTYFLLTHNLFTLNDIPYFLVYKDKMCKLTLNQ